MCACRFVGGCHDQTLHIWHLVYSEELDGFDCMEMACGGYTQKVTVCNWQPGAKAKLLASAGGRALTVWNFEKTPAGTMPLLAIGHTAVITCQVCNDQKGTASAWLCWSRERHLSLTAPHWTVLGHQFPSGHSVTHTPRFSSGSLQFGLSSPSSNSRHADFVQGLAHWRSLTVHALTLLSSAVNTNSDYAIGTERR